MNIRNIRTLLTHSNFDDWIFMGFCISLFFIAPLAYAGTDGAELQPAVAKVQGLISGAGGKLICLSSLGLALISSVMKFNPYLVVGSLGVCMTTALGNGIVNSMVTALI